jgi:hypothetical protein
MRNDLTEPFESIESALEFMVLLEGVIGEVTGELEGRRSESTAERYTTGLNLALYKIHQLLFHVQRSRRILNDLRLIRTVLVADGAPRANEAADESQPPRTVVGASA